MKPASRIAQPNHLAIPLAEEPELHFGRLVMAAILALSMAFAMIFTINQAQASERAEQFVQQTVDDGYNILNNTSLSEDQRFDQFQTFMLGLTDIERIARFTLGPYVNRAPENAVGDFINAFSTYAVTVYEDRLSQYTGQTMRVTGSEDRAEDDSVVTATVVNPANPNAQGFNVAFRVRNDAQGNPIITDMQVEGVWLAISQRADFTSFLQRNNGSVTALANSLRTQAQQIRAGG
jgi:phospholipid transport system substrate-binding protein